MLASMYRELMPDGKAWLFTWVMDAKSVTTFPSGGQQLAGAGDYEISGLAWSGRGAIERVEISTGGGQGKPERKAFSAVLFAPGLGSLVKS